MTGSVSGVINHGGSSTTPGGTGTPIGELFNQKVCLLLRGYQC